MTYLGDKIISRPDQINVGKGYENDHPLNLSVSIF